MPMCNGSYDCMQKKVTEKLVFMLHVCLQQTYVDSENLPLLQC
jgi:hypothetical protein